jgi:hypothetical protein
MCDTGGGVCLLPLTGHRCMWGIDAGGMGCVVVACCMLGILHVGRGVRCGVDPVFVVVVVVL